MRSNGLRFWAFRSLLGLLLFIPTGFHQLVAATRTAASVSLSDVNAAITAAARGDTVLVPAGTSAWSGSLKITKGIRLIGGNGGTTSISRSGVAVSIDPDSTATINEETIQVS